VGRVSATLTVTSWAPSMNVIATLVDVTPEGPARMIVEGATQVRTTDGRATAQVDLGDTAYRLLPGHALRLAVSSSRHPRYIADPGTGESAWDGTEFRVTEQALLLGDGRAGSVSLTTVGR
jgi:putative CocE/NonD family hydrolase